MIPSRPLRCSMLELVKQTFRALLLRHGCTETEAKSVTVNRPLGHPGIATVRCSDGRRLYRVDDLEELDRLAASPLECFFLAREVSRVEASIMD